MKKDYVIIILIILIILVFLNSYFTSAANIVYVNSTGGTYSSLSKALKDNEGTDTTFVLNEANKIYTIEEVKSYNIPSTNRVFLINANNITLDCNNSLIYGLYKGDCIYSYNFNNLTIKNCKIKMYNRGVYILTSSNLNFTNNIIWNNSGMAGRFIWVNNSFFINNTINDTRGLNAVGGWGIQFQVSNHNLISYNRVFGNSEHGIQTDASSSNNTITYNNVSFNDDAALITVGQNNIIAHNYLENNKEGAIYTMFDSNFRNNNTYNKIINNTIIGSIDGPGPASPEGHGMVLWGYDYEVWNNTIINNTRYGIYFLGGNDSIIIGNLFINQTNNSYGAIYFNGSENTQNVIIKNNILINNTFGVFLNNSLYTNWSIINNSINYGLIGLYIKNMNNSDIINNTFNETGNLTNYQINFPLEIYNSSNLNITGNYFYNENDNITSLFFDSDSKNNNIWLNYFRNRGINNSNYNNNYCVSANGNYYNFDVKKEYVGWNDCGKFNLKIYYGDANCDGVVSPMDLILIKKSLIGINVNSQCCISNCTNLDFNYDGIDPEDLMALKSVMMGIPQKFYN